MIWFTADTHFGCDKLVANTRKEFSCIEDHDAALLDRINHHVGRDDRLIIVGDFCKEKPGRYRPKIRCKNIMFVLGNHDKEVKIRRAFGGNVRHQYMTKTTQRPQHKVWCCHYPPAFWPDSHYGAIAAYGHIHDHRGYEEGMDQGLPNRRSMDVGVDVAKRILGEYRPFSEIEVLDLVGNRPGHEELWRDVPGYEKIYQVSTHGNVRSMDRQIMHRGHLCNKGGKTLKLSTDSYGYQVVGLSRNGKAKMHKVHRLVLLAFCGPSNLNVLHGPVGKAANWLTNLSYGTQTEDWEDRRPDRCCPAE